MIRPASDANTPEAAAVPGGASYASSLTTATGSPVAAVTPAVESRTSAAPEKHGGGSSWAAEVEAEAAAFRAMAAR